MSYLGDTLTVSLILVLLFGSIALYLYTRVQQTEQKVSLLESIVLDLKLTGELQPFQGLSEHDPASLVPTSSASPVSPASPASPASPVSPVSPVPASPVSPVSLSSVSSSLPTLKEEYVPFVDAEEEDKEEPVSETIDFLPLDQATSLSELSAPVPSSSPSASASVDAAASYDAMSLKELQSLVRSRSIAVEKGAKKHTLVELLKKQDHEKQDQNEAKPGSTSSPAFLELFPA